MSISALKDAINAGEARQLALLEQLFTEACLAGSPQIRFENGEVINALPTEQKDIDQRWQELEQTFNRRVISVE